MEIGKMEINSNQGKINADTSNQLEIVCSGYFKDDDDERFTKGHIPNLESSIYENKDKILLKGLHEGSNKVAIRNKKRNTCEENICVIAPLYYSENQEIQKRTILRRGVTWKNVDKSSDEKETHSDKVLISDENTFPLKNLSLTQLEIMERRTDENTKLFNRNIPDSFNIWSSSNNKKNNASIIDKNRQSKQYFDQCTIIKSDRRSNLPPSPFITVPTVSDSKSDYFCENFYIEKNCDIDENQESNNSNTEEENDQFFVPLLFGNDVLDSNRYVPETNLKFINENHLHTEFSPQKFLIKVNGEEYCNVQTSTYCKNLCEKDDSDEMDDTWHHKNIKEKIKKILGKKLDLQRYKTEADSKLYNVGKNIKTSHSTKGNKNMDSHKKVSRTFTLADTNYCINNKKLDFDHKNPIPKFMNLTFFTDSDEDAEASHFQHPNLDCIKNESIVNRWELLEAKAKEKQLQTVQVHRLQWQLKSFRMTMENILNSCSAFVLDAHFENFSQISVSLDKLKNLINECDGLKSDMNTLNIQIHRYSSDTAPSISPLKNEMTELYSIWDETHRRVNSELSRMEQIEATYHAWEEQKVELNKALKQDSDALKMVNAAVDNGKLTESVTASVRDVAKLLNERRKYSFVVQNKDQFMSQNIYLRNHELKKKEDHLSDSGTSGYESCSSDDLSERERRLAYLKRLAKDLEASLAPGCSAWKEINSTLNQAEKELKELQDHCRYLILKTTETFDPCSKNFCFSSNSKRRILAREGKNISRNTRREKRMRILGGRRDWMWRVARAAVPFQIALMLLVCVACLLEPNCCDSVNTFNMSFTPQLRFVHGSPPI